MPIDTQKIIEDELEKEQKKSYFYNQRKIGKFDPSKGTEAEQWQRIKGKKTQDELDEEEKQKQRQAIGMRERQAVADADLAAFNRGESNALKKRK